MLHSRTSCLPSMHKTVPPPIQTTPTRTYCSNPLAACTWSLQVGESLLSRFQALLHACRWGSPFSLANALASLPKTPQTRCASECPHSHCTECPHSHCTECPHSHCVACQSAPTATALSARNTPGPPLCTALAHSVTHPTACADFSAPVRLDAWTHACQAAVRVRLDPCMPSCSACPPGAMHAKLQCMSAREQRLRETAHCVQSWLHASRLRGALRDAIHA